MPRKKLRPDNKPYIYKFDGQILGHVPQIVYDTAKAMRDLWNELCTAHYKMRSELGIEPTEEIVNARIAAIETSNGKPLTKEGKSSIWAELREEYKGKVSKETIGNAYARFIWGRPDKDKQAYLKLVDADRETPLTRSERKLALKGKTFGNEIPDRDTIAYQIAKIRGDELELSFSCKWQVYNRFKTAMQNWVKAPFKNGPPRPHHGLDFINIPFVCESGGVSIDWIWADTWAKTPDNDFFTDYYSRKAVQIIKPDESAYFTKSRSDTNRRGAIAYFRIGDTRIPLQITLHREIPDDVILKRVSLVGKRHGASLRREWSLQLLVEKPPITLSTATSRVAALDLGWRKLNDGLRIGMLYDGHSYHELFLPFDLANADGRKSLAMYSKCSTRTNMKYAWLVQKDRDQAKDDCKALIIAADKQEWPLDAKKMIHAITKMGIGGLRRLHRILTDAQMCPDWLDVWIQRDNGYSLSYSSSFRKYVRSRDAIYRNIAAWMARNFTVIAWEDDLNLKEMAEDDKPDNYSIDAAQKHRVIASLHLLRDYIRQAMARHGRELIGQTAYSTVNCPVEGCGEQMTPTPNLIISCSLGHSDDQDVIACQNLWLQLPTELRAPPPSGTSVDRSQILDNIRRLTPAFASAASAVAIDARRVIR